MGSIPTLAVAILVASALALPAAANGAARNGLIAFEVIQYVVTCDQCGPNGESETTWGGSRIWLVRADGTGVRRLPCTSARGLCRDRDPAFSHDGRKLAVLGAEGLVVMTPRGRVLRRIDPFPGWSPSWAPGGRRLAFAAGEENRPARSVAITDLRGNVRVAHEGRPHDVAWSRQGRLAWAGSFFEGSHGIHTGDPEGERRRRVSHRGMFVSWSPDGSRIAFSARRGIGVARADGARFRFLTRGCSVGYDFAGGVAWSPDGREIACSSRPNEVLVALDLSTMRLRRVSSRRDFGDGYVGEMAWQRRPARRPGLVTPRGSR